MGRGGGSSVWCDRGTRVSDLGGRVFIYLFMCVAFKAIFKNEREREREGEREREREREKRERVRERGEILLTQRETGILLTQFVFGWIPEVRTPYECSVMSPQDSSIVVDHSIQVVHGG